MMFNFSWPLLVSAHCLRAYFSNGENPRTTSSPLAVKSANSIVVLLLTLPDSPPMTRAASLHRPPVHLRLHVAPQPIHPPQPLVAQDRVHGALGETVARGGEEAGHFFSVGKRNHFIAH